MFSCTGSGDVRLANTRCCYKPRQWVYNFFRNKSYIKKGYSIFVAQLIEITKKVTASHPRSPKVAAGVIASGYWPASTVQVNQLRLITKLRIEAVKFPDYPQLRKRATTVN